ncbi:MAG: I78 family peptidase inhibitor [Polaromonas sp.]|nr:I78 family peptidase inhibitor [Polaromonas sp.]
MSLKKSTLRTGFAALALPVLLAACAAPSSGNPSTAIPGTAGPAAGGTCNAAPAQAVLGRVATAAVVEDARQRSGARMARVLRPNQVVTMEFSAERLNLSVDAASKITRVTCG